jgi:propionate CoA-transferase
MQIDGEEWRFYKTFPITVAFLRGTTAEVTGNITMEHEALSLDNLALAMAAKNSNGFVIVQVERIAAPGVLKPRNVVVPGVLVDCVVQASHADHHRQTYGTAYHPAFAGEFRVPLDMLAPMPLDERKVIARRSAFELPMGGVVNLGIGMPEGVASVANEERILNYVTLTAEPGVIGGIPQGGLDFGAAVNTEALLHQNQQFDFYDGGGLDMACLGMAQADAEGHINVSRFGPKLAGAGGFINISQNARRLVFAGTLTAGALEVEVKDGQLRILQERRTKKFIHQVEQITFNGSYAAERGQPVLYVTVDRVRRTVEEKAQEIGKKFALVVNYTDFLIDAAVADTYAAMLRYMKTHYYTTSSRYTTSAFLRLKLGEALSRRRVAPHIFEAEAEAQAFVGKATRKGASAMSSRARKITR